MANDGAIYARKHTLQKRLLYVLSAKCGEITLCFGHTIGLKIREYNELTQGR
jgi:hypothetical protein